MTVGCLEVSGIVSETEYQEMPYLDDRSGPTQQSVVTKAELARRARKLGLSADDKRASWLCIFYYLFFAGEEPLHGQLCMWTFLFIF